MMDGERYSTQFTIHHSIHPGPSTREATVARIVCQVLNRADRITFLWSEGVASFQPYHLEGAERANLLELAGQIHAKFTEEDGTALAQLGYRLYRAVFRQDANEQGSAGAVQTWLAGLVSSNAIERLEFLSDA